MGNVQIVEHLEAKGVELQFHYLIRSKNESQNRKMIFSRVVENVTENDMRMFIKTRIEKYRFRN